MEINYRRAKKDECSVIAELINEASSGLVEFLFHNLTPGKNHIEFLAHSLTSDKSHYSYRNAEVAVIGNDIAGMTVSFDAEKHRITDEMRAFFPHDRLEHLREMYNSRVPGSLYIDALAVRKKYRRGGVASGLLARVEGKAIELGKKTISLIVLADNHPAFNLYKKIGFEKVKHIPLEYHDLIPHQGGAFLLKHALNR